MRRPSICISIDDETGGCPACGFLSTFKVSHHKATGHDAAPNVRFTAITCAACGRHVRERSQRAALRAFKEMEP